MTSNEYFLRSINCKKELLTCSEEPIEADNTCTSSGKLSKVIGQIQVILRSITMTVKEVEWLVNAKFQQYKDGRFWPFTNSSGTKSLRWVWENERWNLHRFVIFSLWISWSCIPKIPDLTPLWVLFSQQRGWNVKSASKKIPDKTSFIFQFSASLKFEKGGQDWYHEKWGWGWNSIRIRIRT